MSSGDSSENSCCALPLRWPANCNTRYESVKLFHSTAHSKLGSQSPHCSSELLVLNGLVNGAFCAGKIVTSSLGNRSFILHLSGVKSVFNGNFIINMCAFSLVISRSFSSTTSSYSNCCLHFSHHTLFCFSFVTAACSSLSFSFCCYINSLPSSTVPCAWHENSCIPCNSELCSLSLSFMLASSSLKPCSALRDSC